MNRSMYMIIYYDLEQLKNAIEILNNKVNKGFEQYQNFKYGYCLHDKDIKADLTFKKAHYHLVLKFQQAIHSDELFKVLKEYLPNHIHEDINECDVKGWAYLIHANCPKKVQYDFKNIVSNMDRDNLYELVEKYRKKDTHIAQADYLISLLNFINEHDIYNFKKLITILVSSGEKDLLGFCTKNVYLVRSLFDVR